MSWATTKRLLILAALLSVPHLTRAQVTLVRSLPEPLPNCVPSTQLFQAQPLVWDITAQVLKTCIAVNTWGSIGSGGGGGGSVTAFTASGSTGPFFTYNVTNNTTTPNLAFTITAQNANCLLAGPASGGAAVPTCRPAVSADIPPINLASSANGGVTGLLPIANTCPGAVGASSSTFLRGDCTWSTPAGAGTVTHTVGALTLNAVIIGNGTADIQALGSLGTTVTVLHGNAAGPPSFGAVNLAAEVTGLLPIANNCPGSTGASNTTFLRGDCTWATPPGNGTVNAAPQFSIAGYLNAGSSNVVSGISTPSAPNGLPQFFVEIPAAGAATVQVFAPAGVPGRSVATASDTVLYTDRANLLNYTDNAAVALAVPQAGSANFQFNYVFASRYVGNNLLTETPTTSTVNGAPNIVLGTNDYCTWYSIDNANYLANCTHGESTIPLEADTGAANAYVLTYPLIQVVAGAVPTGSSISFTVANPNTGASTINVNSLGVKNLTKKGNAALINGDLLTGVTYFAGYDGTQWELSNPSTSVFGTFAPHQFFGNNGAGTASPLPSLIGSSDTSPNWYATDSGAVNAYVVAPSPAVTALSTGTTVTFSTSNPNTGASTINVSSLGVKSLTKRGAVALGSGDILASAVYQAEYDGTQWELLNPSTTSGSSGTVNNCTINHALGWFASTGTAISCLGESDATQYEYAADSGVANAYVVTLAPALASLQTGDRLTFNTTHPNSGASTINVNALGVKNITKLGTTALVTGDIVSANLYVLEWDGTEWQLLNPSITPYANLTPATFDSTATGLAQPAGNGAFTFPNTATNGLTLSGAAPASVAGNGTNAMNLFVVTGVIGGATSSTVTNSAGQGSSPAISAGNGGAATGVGTSSTVGGNGGNVTLGAGNGGPGQAGNDSGGQGGSVFIQPGIGGSKSGSGVAGLPGFVSVTAPAAFNFYLSNSISNAVTNSPILNFLAEYQNSGTPTFSGDFWTLQDVVGAGTNGTSTLTALHSGTSGASAFSVPNLIDTALTSGDCVSSGTGGLLGNATGVACGVPNPPFDKSATGLSNPTADATFTQPATSATGWTLAGTAPASSAGATGTNATSLLNVNGVTGGADSNATGVAGVGSSPSITAGNGGAGTGTNTVGGAGGSLTFTTGNGGASLGTGNNSNGGNFVINLGIAGTGGSGTAGKSGLFEVNGTGAGAYGLAQGTDNCVAVLVFVSTGACVEAPASGMTNYRWFIPPVAATGVITNNSSSNVITQGFSGDASHSTVVTIGSGTSIGSTSLCSAANCPVGTYDVSVYVDITTACGTSGTYIVNLIYTDDQGAKTVPVNLQGTGSTPLTGTLTTTSTANFGQEVFVLRSTGSTSINYSTTATACGTAGPMVGKLYLSATPKQ